MIKTFHFEPFIGARPIAFGTNMKEVDQLLGNPAWTNPGDRGSRTAGYFDKNDESGFTISFDSHSGVNEITFARGIALMFQGRNLLELHDLIPFLTTIDPNPEAAVGIVVFRKIGISCDIVFDPNYVSPGDPRSKYREDRWRRRSVTCFSSSLINEPSFGDGLKPYKPG